MIRLIVIIVSIALWLISFGTAILTIIPLSAIGLAAIFDGHLTLIERLQGFGFLAFGLAVVAGLLFALTFILRLFAKEFHAPNP